MFKVNPDGTGLSILHYFSRWGSYGYGQSPAGGLLLGSDGLLYGTTRDAGEIDLPGTVFRVNPDGTGFTCGFTAQRAGGSGSWPAPR